MDDRSAPDQPGNPAAQGVDASRRAAPPASDADAQVKRPGAEPVRATGICDILDVIFICSTALFLLFVVFWLAGVERGQPVLNSLPDWLSGAAKSGKAALTALGTSTILQLLRARLNRNTSPQYIGWILTLFFVLGGSAVGLSKMLPAPPKPSAKPIPAEVHFTAGYSENTKILFVHQYPQPIRNEALVDQPKEASYPPTYLAHIFLPPGTAEHFTAVFKKEVAASSQHQPQESGGEGYSTMCLHQAEGDHAGVADIFLKCQDYDCVIDKSRDKGMASTCDGQSAQATTTPGQLSGVFSLPRVFAAATADHTLKSSVPFWTVPLLETLENTKDRERVGYTRFDIDLQPSAELRNIDSYQYQVMVNGQPIFFNGLPPDVFRNGFNPRAGVHISFGLENLSFSGQHEGFEELSVVFTFFSKGKQTAQQVVQRKYAALRNAEPVDQETNVGRFHWTGTYKPGMNENKYEIIVNSTPAVAAAMQMKSSLDGLALNYGAQRVVLVVRPPLRIPPFYGVVVGLVQPSGQVKFTFDQDEVSQLCSWALVQKTRLIRSDLRRYEPGTRAYNYCR